MGYGERVDTVVGTFSRLLHMRGASHDTTKDLTPYVDRPLAELLPAPPGAPVVRRRAPLVSGARVTETLSWKSAHEPLCEKYERRHHHEYRKNQIAWSRWMHPRGGQRKSLLLYVHGWLEPGSWVEEATLMPSWYKNLGVDVAHVQLPFHGRRGPRGQLFHGEWFWTADLVRSLEAVRQAVMDVRSAIAHFRAEGYEEIGVTGLSLGGSITMVLACVDPAPDYIVPMIAHLKLAAAVEEASILWRMKSDLDRLGFDQTARKELFSHLAISTAKPLLAPEKQLWVAAEEDAYLRADLVRQQADEWGHPEVLWIRGGHMTFPLQIDRINAAMKRMPKLAAPL